MPTHPLRVLLPSLLLSTAAMASPPTGDTVFLVLFDGTSWPVAEQLYAEGRLPHLRALVEEGDGRLLRAVTSFPSSTAPVMPELLGGRFLDRAPAGTLGRIQAFDREQGRVLRHEFNRLAWDRDPDDLFDLVHRGGRGGWSYFEGAFEGASRGWYSALGYRITFLTGYAKLGSRGYDRVAVRRLCRDLRQAETPPALVLVALGHADIVGHAWGPDHPRYADALAREDRALGRLVDTARSTPHPEGGTLWDHSHFYVFGDHGMAPSGEWLRLGAQLDQSGLPTADSGDFAEMLRAQFGRQWPAGEQAVVMAIGSNAAEIHVRALDPGGTPRPWAERPGYSDLRARPGPAGPVDLPGLLAAHPGVDHVMIREGEGMVRVLASGGAELRVVREGRPEAPRRFAVEVLSLDGTGQDPFRYGGTPAEALLTPAGEGLRFHGEDDWLRATAGTRYPYASALLPKAFTPDPTTPDLLVTARPGWSAIPVVVGDHGNLEADSVTSFLVAAHPGHPELVPPPADLVRLLDVNAEVRWLLGLPADPMADSRGLGVVPVVAELPPGTEGAGELDPQPPAADPGAWIP